MHMRAIFLQSALNDEEEKKRKRKKFLRKFADSYLGNGLRDLIQIYNVASPAWRLTPL